MSVEDQMEADTSPARSGEDQLKLIFDLCDQDKDGFITAQDFRSLGNEHFGNTQVRERERDRDRDRDRETDTSTACKVSFIVMMSLLVQYY